MVPTLLDPRGYPRTAAACPHCGAGTRGEASPIATFYVCGACGLEWIDHFVLDFQTD